MKKLITCLLLILLLPPVFRISAQGNKIHILIITGGHDYNKESFSAMFSSMSDSISYEIKEFPAAFDMFKPENSASYDVLVFYHMWQTISEEQKKNLAQCISGGKPLVVLHHSICAFDDWPEYTNIIGGKYFHKPTLINDRLFPGSSYIHDVHFRVKVKVKNNPVTKGLMDFDIFDETYKDFYVESSVQSILETDEPSSTPIIGWTKLYGKARVVTIQLGHDLPTFENPDFRKLLLQAIQWVHRTE